MDWSQILSLFLTCLGTSLTTLGLPPLARRIWRRPTPQSDEREQKDLEEGGGVEGTPAQKDIKRKFKEILDAISTTQSTVRDEGTEIGRGVEDTPAQKETESKLDKILSAVTEIHKTLRGQGGGGRFLKARDSFMEKSKNALERGGGLKKDTNLRKRDEEDNPTKKQHFPSISSTPNQRNVHHHSSPKNDASQSKNLSPI